MNRWIIPFLLIVFLFFAGCVQTPQDSDSSVVSPESVQSLIPTQATPVAPSPNISPTQTAVNITPVPSPVYTKTPEIVSTPDPDLEFRSMVVSMMDLLQSAKEGLLLTYSAGDTSIIGEKTQELIKMVRKNSVLSNVPKKMDYVKVNYNEYIDQMNQFTQSFKSGAERLSSGDNASARSYFDAGKIASERADIAVKRIHTFLKDHPLTG